MLLGWSKVCGQRRAKCLIGATAQVFVAEKNMAVKVHWYSRELHKARSV